MKKLIKLLLSGILTQCSYSKSIMIPFFSDTVYLEIPEYRLFKGKVSEGFDKLYALNDFSTLKYQLQKLKKERRLNDYYVLVLIEKVFSSCFENVQYAQKQKVLFVQSVLNDLDFDVKVASSGLKYFLFFDTDVPLYHELYTEVKKKKFYRLYPFGSKSSLFSVIKEKPKKRSRPFEISKTELPTFENQRLKKRKFNMMSSDEFVLVLDSNYLNYYSALPIMYHTAYFDCELSDSLSYQLKKLFKDDFYGKSSLQQVRILLSFCRKITNYKSDEELYRKSRHFYAEEMFWYEYADCEDFSTLFVIVTQLMTDLDIIVLEYPNHINFAINIPNTDVADKQYIEYNSRKYVLCEPTDPNDILEVGFSSNFELNSSPQIIWSNKK